MKIAAWLRLPVVFLPGCALLSLSISQISLAADKPQITVEKESTGVVMRSGAETLRVIVCGPSVLHVVAGPGEPRASSPQQPWIVAGCPASSFEFATGEKEDTLSTARLRVVLNHENGSLTFKDSGGGVLLQENGDHPRRYVPVVLNAENVHQVSDRFMPAPEEGLYGLGQHQAGIYNYRGAVIELAQQNTDVAFPFLVSTKGYGMLWNTASKSWVDNRFPTILKLSAEAADAIDYYFVYGPEMDEVIHQYRELTGHAPLFAKWAYGFWQSKDRYRSAQELLDVAEKYRSQHVPLDGIVQDWYWWERQGDPEYTASYLKPHPDVPGAIQKLHEQNIHAMISVWAVLDPKSNNYKQMEQDKEIIPNTPLYDPTNPAAREAYWKLLAGKVFAQGWDAFWLDSSEPETFHGDGDAALFDKQLAIGSGARYTNIFPLMHTGNIYDHWRKTTEQKRVFLLTRSAFLGQQRNATTVWSGDVTGTFLTFTRQIPAGLNFALSGMPYWTTDIAGYGWPYERDTRDPRYQELYARWYQFGAFCPIFRTHGHRSNDTNEVFSYGPVTPILVNYDKLRYRLMPYIYSLAWRVTNEDYTMQRPLVMDWRTTEKVRDIGDQFMFGPALLVNPVTLEGAKSRQVYLPPSAAWYDFWTGERLQGDQRIEAAAPLDRIPLYVRAGSILPMGPEIEYATQKPVSPIELRIYAGADGSFDLYSDEGDSYAYEKGAYATIPIRWNDTTHTLTLGKRAGTYPGMEKELLFRVVMVDAHHGAGQAVADSAQKEVRYTGEEVSVPLN
jgi:alpha-D-xyloside xylohydrolase